MMKFGVSSLVVLLMVVSHWLRWSEASTTCNILSYGARADDQTDISTAINTAIASCVAKTTGATLLIPAGNFFLNTSVTFHTRSNWIFRLDGVVRLDPTKFPSGTVLTFLSQTNVRITGNGQIDGQGQLVWQFPNGPTARGAAPGGPHLLVIQYGSNVELDSITINNAPSYSVVVENMVGGNIHHLKIVNNPQVSMTDGIDYHGSGFSIHDNYVKVGDDCICAKNNAHDINVYNNVCVGRGGFNIGSVGGGTSVYNLWFNNNTAIDTTTAAFIKATKGGSGNVTNITYMNMNVQNSQRSIVITGFYLGQTSTATTAVAFTDFKFVNFRGYTEAYDGTHQAITFDCDAYSPCRDIVVSNYAVSVNTHSSCSNAYGTGSCLAK